MTVEDGERSTVLDAMALLGGNEYLVQQMVEASVGPNYSNYPNSLVKNNFSVNMLVQIQTELNSGVQYSFT